MHQEQVVFFVRHETLEAEIKVCNKSDVTQNTCMDADNCHIFNSGQ